MNTELSRKKDVIIPLAHELGNVMYMLCTSEVMVIQFREVALPQMKSSMNQIAIGNLDRVFGRRILIRDVVSIRSYIKTFHAYFCEAVISSMVDRYEEINGVYGIDIFKNYQVLSATRALRHISVHAHHARGNPDSPRNHEKEHKKCIDEWLEKEHILERHFMNLSLKGSEKYDIASEWYIDAIILENKLAILANKV